MIAILVVGHLQAFIDTPIEVVIHFSDGKWASWVTVEYVEIVIFRLHLYYHRWSNQHDGMRHIKRFLCAKTWTNIGKKSCFLLLRSMIWKKVYLFGMLIFFLIDDNHCLSFRYIKDTTII